MLPVSSIGGFADSLQAALPASQGAAGSAFLATLSSVAVDTGHSLRDAEAVSIRALQGGASVREVVDAVMRAEQSLQTAIALRDKTVAAIQEITRMSI